MKAIKTGNRKIEYLSESSVDIRLLFRSLKGNFICLYQSPCLEIYCFKKEIFKKERILNLIFSSEATL